MEGDQTVELIRSALSVDIVSSSTLQKIPE
jgi:hypothetical protein